MKRTSLTPFFPVVLLLAACGCAFEGRIQPPESVPPPDWTINPPAPGDGMRYYVGIAIVENVLEERQGRRRAIVNAAELASQSIVVAVGAEVTVRATTLGPAHKGQEDKQSVIVEEVKSRTDEVVRGLVPKKYYYEQWEIREKDLGPSFKRYKYYVLCAYPEAEYQRLVNAVNAKIK